MLPACIQMLLDCYTYLHEVLLQQAIDPRLSHLHGPHFIGDVTTFDKYHLQLHTTQGQRVEATINADVSNRL